MNQPNLITLPADRQERWDQIRAFIAEWHRPLGENDGIPSAELDAAEQRMGCRIPAALREWYQMAGRRGDLTRMQNYLLAPDELACEPDDEVVIFYAENQWVVGWGIRREDWDLDDPPVVMSWLGDSDWIDDSCSVSEFVFQALIMETQDIMRFSDYAHCTDATLNIVEQHFLRFDFADWHWPLHPTRFFRSADALVVTMGPDQHARYYRGPEVFITAKSRDELLRVAELLEVNLEARSWEEEPE